MEKEIKKIKEVGFFTKSLNITKEGLLNIIKNMTTTNEVTILPEFIGKYLDADMLDALANKKIEGNSALNLLKPAVVDFIPQYLFNKIDNATLGCFTAEQLKNINTETVDALLKKNKLQYFNNETLAEISKKADFSYKYSINVISGKPVFDEIKKQIESLENKEKLQFLSDMALKTIADDYYSIKEVKNLNKFNKNQIKIFEKNFKNLGHETLKNLEPGTLAKFTPDTILNLNYNELKNFNDNCLNYIKTTNPELSLYENEEIQPIISDDIENILKIEKKQYTREDMSFSIKKYIKEENYSKLENYCISISKKDIYKQDIYIKNIKEVLDEEIANCENNIYGIIDKLELLKNKIILEKDKKIVERDFTNMINSIKKVASIKPANMDEYFCKSNLFSKLIREGNFNLDFQEKLAEENLKNIEECIKNNYSLSERNSLDNPLKELKAKTLMEYCEVLSKKYKIDPEKFKQNNEFLTKYESIYLDSIKEAINLEPNLESAIKSWATPILKIATKAVLARVAVGVTAGRVSTAIGVAGTALVAADVINEYDKKNYFLNPESYHKKSRERKEGFFMRNYRRAKSTVMEIVNYPINKVKLFLKGEAEKKGFEKKDDNIPMDIKSILYKKNICGNSCKNILNYQKSEEKFFLDGIHNKLKNFNNTKLATAIKNYMELKKKALEIQIQRNIEELYIKYPQFKKEEGLFQYFNRVKEAIKDTTKGLMGSIFDVATFGVGSDLYEKFVDNKTGEEKIKNKIELQEFQKHVEKINKNFAIQLNQINLEECEKLANMNEKDGENLKNLLKHQEENKKETEGFFFGLTSNFDADNKIEILLKYGDNNRKFDKNIEKSLNGETKILNSIEKLASVRDIQNANNQLLDLINFCDDKEIILKNGEKFNKFIQNEVNKGELDLKEADKYMQTLFFIAKNYKEEDVAQSIVDNYTIVENKTKNIRQNINIHINKKRTNNLTIA